MDTPITRAEHEEFRKRVEERDARQDKRLELVEDNISQILTRQITMLTTTVEKIALNVDNILKEQSQQSMRLDELESRDGDMWRTGLKYALSAAIGGLICFALAKLGMK